MTELSLKWEKLQEASLICANEVAEALEHDVEICLPTLSESYARSSNAAKVFSLPNGLNYFKESGVICYWLTKLKPFSISYDEIKSGDFEDSLRKFPLNECISLRIATKLVKWSQSAALRLEDDSRVRADNILVQDANFEKLRKMDKDLVNSLRYFIFSSGSMPLILEAIFRLPIDDKAAFHE